MKFHEALQKADEGQIAVLKSLNTRVIRKHGLYYDARDDLPYRPTVTELNSKLWETE